MKEKKDEAVNSKRIDRTLERLEKKLGEHDARIDKAMSFNMNIFRVIFTALASIIAIAVFVLAFLVGKSWLDIQRTVNYTKTFVRNAEDSVKRAYKRVERIDGMLKKAMIEQMIVLDTHDGLTTWERQTKYKPIYWGFPKKENFITISLMGEFRSSIDGDTAFIRFYAADKEETIPSSEFKTISSNFVMFERSINISNLRDGVCEYGYGVKTQKKNAAELRNVYIIVYSKLPTDMKEKNK